MTKRIALIIVTAIIIIGAIVAWYHWPQHKPQQQPTATAIYITSTTVHTANVPEQVNTIGSLHAWQQVDISPQISEAVKSIAFTGGQRVHKGQILFQLDNAIYQAAYNSAKSALDAAQAKYQRYIALRKSQSVAEQDVENVTANYRSKLAAFNQAKVNLDKMTLSAPFSGRISARRVDIGQYVTSGQPLATLANERQLKLIYALPQQYLHLLHNNQRVIIHSNATPHQTFIGRVYYVSPSIDPKTRTIILHAKVSNRHQRLSAGLFVSVSQILSIKNGAMVIPERAILPSIAGPTVYVIKNHHAQLRSIKTGVHKGTLVEVISGLKPGDSIATTGLLKLKDGARVNTKQVTP